MSLAVIAARAPPARSDTNNTNKPFRTALEEPSFKMFGIAYARKRMNGTSTMSASRFPMDRFFSIIPSKYVSRTSTYRNRPLTVELFFCLRTAQKDPGR